MRVRLSRGIVNCSVRVWVLGSTARRDRRIGAGDQAWRTQLEATPPNSVAAT